MTASRTLRSSPPSRSAYEIRPSPYRQTNDANRQLPVVSQLRTASTPRTKRAACGERGRSVRSQGPTPRSNGERVDRAYDRENGRSYRFDVGVPGPPVAAGAVLAEVGVVDEPLAAGQGTERAANGRVRERGHGRHVRVGAKQPHMPRVRAQSDLPPRYEIAVGVAQRSQATAQLVRDLLVGIDPQGPVGPYVGDAVRMQQVRGAGRDDPEDPNASWRRWAGHPLGEAVRVGAVDDDHLVDDLGEGPDDGPGARQVVAGEDQQGDRRTCSGGGGLRTGRHDRPRSD